MLPTFLLSGPVMGGFVVGSVAVVGAAAVKVWQDRDLVRPRLAASMETRRRASEQRKHLNQASAGMLRNKDLGTGDNGGQFAKRRHSADEVTSL
ncbi:hypothetical protein [Curtobacterium sp. MCSS17_016]|uniref:hypothetical protein n=1 Tax=Curtobacterium sp. MCSS17_016 TaxID=2175644 RepID=UPI0011B734E0|nr:hypothetical protein [Curtobacterium sp. MCSS17_016]WIE81181.1 hypothetical protein DEJ19_018280 [Curtobacterium sp. MCSS17_016]